MHQLSHVFRCPRHIIITAVFRLRQSTTISGDSDTSHNIVALAPLQATESVATAHERDLMEWREMVEDGRYKQQTKTDGAIQPADAIAPLKDSSPVSNAGKLIVEEEAASSRASTANLSSNRHKAFSGKAQKVTTAASFFGSNNNNNKAKNNNSAPAKSSNAATSSQSSITSNSKSNQKPPQPTKAKENKVRSNPVAPAKASTKSSSKPKSFGNADDFVADEEESDEEEDEIQVKKQTQADRRKAIQEANKQAEETPVDEDGGDDDEEKAKVVGAMDAFATAAPVKPAVTTHNTGTRQRKRRKKLVEETVMVNGYLRTETKAIWEDVPSDEEEEEKEQERQRAAKKPFKPSKPQQGMKQKSLMGFFAKK
jgi:hypothetical protein